jgi:predicted transcriptional regulator
MAVVSVRLNDEEEKILEYLTDYFHEDKSTLFKKSMFELYEDIQDIRFIESYSNDSKKKGKKFITGSELLD